MTYAWYEILGMAVLVGIVCFVVFRGLDLLLEWWLARKIRAEITEMNREHGSGG